jgi:carbon storage regulator CsrA
MLVLTRKVGERIQIGDNVTIVVTKCAGNRVTLGIEAPKNVRIIRGELEQFADAFGKEATEPETEQTEAAVAFPFLGADASTFVPTNAR